MFKLKLALKYFLHRPVSWLATFVVAVSVFIVMVVMTVMHGVVLDYTQKNHKIVGDCIVHTDSLVGFPYYQKFMQKLNEQSFIDSTTGIVKNFSLMSLQGYDWSYGVDIIGIEPESFNAVTDFNNGLYIQSDEQENIFECSQSNGKQGCIRGIALMNSRDHQGNYTHMIDHSAKLIITCFPLSYKGTLAKAGTDIVNTKSFNICNDYESGVAKVDSSVIYIPFETAQLLCGMAGSDPRVSAIYIKLKENQDLSVAIMKIEELWQSFIKDYEGTRFYSLLQNVKVEDWKTYRSESIAPMEKEQTMLIALFMLIGLVTVFVVFVIFFMIINHKRKDIGIYKSFGISSVQLNKVFLIFSSFIGISGAVFGSAAGWFFLMNINKLEDWLFDKMGWQLWDRTIYNIGDIPNEIRSEVVLSIFISALIACLIGAFLPVQKAVRLKPVEILQVDQL